MHASAKQRSLREAQGVLAAYDAQVEEVIAADRDAVDRALAEPFERANSVMERMDALRREAEASREKVIKAGNEVKGIRKGIAECVGRSRAAAAAARRAAPARPPHPPPRTHTHPCPSRPGWRPC